MSCPTFLPWDSLTSASLNNPIICSAVNRFRLILPSLTIIQDYANTLTLKLDWFLGAGHVECQTDIRINGH